MATSRLTFREQTEVCWQKRLRDQFNEEGCPPVPHLSVKQSHIRLISRQSAEQIILKYEWLGTMAPTGQHFGVFFGPYLAGVTCFAKGYAVGGTNIHKPFGVQQKELAILARGACTHWAPPGTNSRLVSISSRMLLKTTPCKLIIAYSDSDAGEIGTIYQACNWVYIGKGSSTQQFVSPQGRVMDQKLPWDIARRLKLTRADVSQHLKSEGWTVQQSNPKGRYIYTLDPEVKRQIEKMRQPYPKRPISIGSDALTTPG